MAIHRLPILNAFCKPDNNGNTYWEPAAVNFLANDRYDAMVLAFTSQAAKQGIAGKFTIPKNFIGTAKIIIKWGTTATSGDAAWAVAYRAIAATESLDPTTDQEAPTTITQTAPGTARLLAETNITLTSGNFAIDDEVFYNFYRDAAAAGDTLAATAWLIGLFFEYTDV